VWYAGVKSSGMPLVITNALSAVWTAHNSSYKDSRVRERLRSGFLSASSHSVSSYSSSVTPFRQRDALLNFGGIVKSTKTMHVQSKMRELHVGLGIAGMRWIEHRIPTNVKVRQMQLLADLRAMTCPASLSTLQPCYAARTDNTRW